MSHRRRRRQRCRWWRLASVRLPPLAYRRRCHPPMQQRLLRQPAGTSRRPQHVLRRNAHTPARTRSRCSGHRRIRTRGWCWLPVGKCAVGTSRHTGRRKGTGGESMTCNGLPRLPSTIRRSCDTGGTAAHPPSSAKGMMRACHSVGRSRWPGRAANPRRSPGPGCRCGPLRRCCVVPFAAGRERVVCRHTDGLDGPCRQDIRRRRHRREGYNVRCSHHTAPGCRRRGCHRRRLEAAGGSDSRRCNLAPPWAWKARWEKSTRALPWSCILPPGGLGRKQSYKGLRRHCNSRRELFQQWRWVPCLSWLWLLLWW